MQTVEDLGTKILDVVVNNFDYFKERPAHLAWAMMNYELIHRVGDDSPNPRDAILGVAEKLSEQDGNLLYDAWVVTVSHGCEFPDTNPNLPLESKCNRTMDEWVSLFTNSSYRFKSLFPDEFAAKDYLLCQIRTRYIWNDQGFITNVGPSGVDNDLFAGYTRSEESIDADIKGKILEARSDLSIRTKAEAHLSEAYEVAKRIYSGEDWLEAVNPRVKGGRIALEELQRRLDGLPKEICAELGSVLDDKTDALEPKERKHYPLSEHSNLVRMPTNTHQSYVTAGIEIAHNILASPNEPQESKRFAREFLEHRAA
jgi:hypothetical protein